MKLNRLKDLDKDLKIFSARDHKYVLNPPLTEAEVTAFETANGLRLPEEYRLYLTQIANGGAGPFYGLNALGDNGDQTVDLSKDFEFDRSATLLLAAVFEEEDADELYEIAWRMANQGIIYLAHEGCGMYSVLVIKGKEHGCVWYSDFSNDVGLFPLVYPQTGEPLGFFDWFEIWLDAALACMENDTEELQGYAEYIQQE